MPFKGNFLPEEEKKLEIASNDSKGTSFRQ